MNKIFITRVELLRECVYENFVRRRNETKRRKERRNEKKSFSSSKFLYFSRLYVTQTLYYRRITWSEVSGRDFLEVLSDNRGRGVAELLRNTKVELRYKIKTYGTKFAYISRDSFAPRNENHLLSA